MFTPGSLKRRLPLAIALAAACVTALSCEMPLELEGPPPPGPAATCYDYGQQIRIASTVPLSYTRDVAVIDGWAFAAAGFLNLVRIDPNGGAAEIKETPTRVDLLATSGQILCAAAYDELLLIDASSAHRGETLGKLRIPSAIQGIAADSRHAYLHTPHLGLWIADISDPAAPRIVGSVAIPGEGGFFDPRNSLAVRGNIVCVILDNTLWLVDISDRSSPRRIGHLQMGTFRIDGVAMIDRFAVASVDGEINVIDIGNPAAPQLVLNSNLANMHVEDIMFDGNRAYLCGDDLVIVDLARPTSPVVAGRLTEVNAYAVAVEGDQVYIAGTRGLLVAKLPTTRRPAPLIWVNGQGDAFRTALQPPIAWVAGGFRGLWAFDIEGNPGVVGRLDIWGVVHDVACDSAYAFMAAGSSGLVVAEGGISDPPRVVSELALPSESWAIVLDGTLAYLAQADFGLWIVDVSNPLSPRVLGSLDTAGAIDLVIRDGRAWIADIQSGLVVADVTDPERPRIIGGIETPAARGLALDGDYAYMVSETGTLQVIEISQPETPKLAGKLELPSVMRDVAIRGDHAYLATEMGLMVADVTDPMAPALIGMAYEGRTAGVMIDKATDRIFVANGNLTVIRPQCDDVNSELSP